MGFSEGFVSGSILKLDVEKKEFVSTWIDPKCLATEPMFVPRPGSTGMNKILVQNFITRWKLYYLLFFLHQVVPSLKSGSGVRINNKALCAIWWSF